MSIRSIRATVASLTIIGILFSQPVVYARGNSTSVVRAKPRCHGALHNKDWFAVNYNPRRFLGCHIDIVAQLYATQVLNNDAGDPIGVSYNMWLDPDTGPRYTVFVVDVSGDPISVDDNSYVRVFGTVFGSTKSFNRQTGVDQGYVPLIKFGRIAIISQDEAIQRGLK